MDALEKRLKVGLVQEKGTPGGWAAGQLGQWWTWPRARCVGEEQV